MPTLLTTTSLFWPLYGDSDALAIQLWAMTIIIAKLCAVYHARHCLSIGISFEQAQRLVWGLMVFNALYANAWGAAAWITLGTASAVESILVLAVLSGVVGSSMATLSPVLPVFVVFVVFEMAAVAGGLWFAGNPAYRTLGFATVVVVYGAKLVLHARNSAIATRAAINLRFENIYAFDGGNLAVASTLLFLEADKPTWESYAFRPPNHAKFAWPACRPASFQDRGQPYFAEPDHRIRKIVDSVDRIVALSGLAGTLWPAVFKAIWMPGQGVQDVAG